MKNVPEQREQNKETDSSESQIKLSAADVAEKLASDIHAGRYREGDMLPSERELCDVFDAGRYLIRDAITILQGMGLVDLSKGKRPRVIAPALSNVLAGMGDAAKFFFSGSEGMAHLEQARLFLETSVLRYAAEFATNAQKGKLVEAVKRCEACVDDIKLFRDADVDFHRILNEIPANPIFTALHDTFVKQLMKNRPVLDDFRERNRASNAEHKMIVEAVIDGDAEAAIAVLTKHLSRNYGTYFRHSLRNDSDIDSRHALSN